MRRGGEVYRQIDALPSEEAVKKRQWRWDRRKSDRNLLLFLAVAPGSYFVTPVFDLLINWFIRLLPRFRKYFALAGAVAGFVLFFHTWFDAVFTYVADLLAIHQGFIRVPAALLSGFALASVGDALVEFVEEILGFIALVGAALLTFLLYAAAAYAVYRMYLARWGGDPIRIIERMETFAEELFTSSP